MSLDVEIRHLEKKDAPLVIGLACELDMEIAAAFNLSSNMTRVMKQYSNRHLVEAADFIRLVAYSGHDLAGYAIATPNPLMDGEERREIFELAAPQKVHSMMADMIVVSQYKRNKGLGKSLMRCVIDDARSKGADSVCGYVAKWNEASMHMLTSLGFERRKVFPLNHLYVLDLK
jgi:ribosomal protein S18 acetylase RimI-like enzyme